MGGFADGNSYLFVIAPEVDSAEDAFFVGDDADVFGWGEEDFFGVAAAEVEVVPAEELDAVCVMASSRYLFQRLFAELIETAAADVVLVGFFAPGMVAQFEDGKRNGR